MTTAVKHEFVEKWEELWARPSEEKCRPLVTDDVIAYWSGVPEPIRGGDAYAGHVGRLAKLLPDLRLEATEHAHVGEVVFISWRATATIGGQPFEHEGIDRFRIRDGKSRESLVAYDPQPFARALQDAAGQAGAAA